ncbi:MAG: hypothetical protein AAGF12_07855 [Myxococcota bacterium]
MSRPEKDREPSLADAGEGNARGSRDPLAAVLEETERRRSEAPAVVYLDALLGTLTSLRGQRAELRVGARHPCEGPPGSLLE